MTETAVLAVELAQAAADLLHLRRHVAERRVNGDVLALGEYQVASLRRRLWRPLRPGEGEGGAS